MAGKYHFGMQTRISLLHLKWNSGSFQTVSVNSNRNWSFSWYEVMILCVCVFLLYIYIYVDTKFCALNLILEDDWNDHSKYPKNYKCISCIKSFITYHKNDLEILTIVTNMSGSQIGPLNWKVSRDQVFTVWMHFIWVKPITCDL